MQITLHGPEFRSCMACQQQNKQINNFCKNLECFGKKESCISAGNIALQTAQMPCPFVC